MKMTETDPDKMDEEALRTALKELLKQQLSTKSKSSSEKPSTSADAAPSRSIFALSTDEPDEPERRNSIALKAPEMYKIGADILAWLARMQNYLRTARINTQREAASRLANGLSQDAYAAMFNLDLPERVWNSYDELVEQLKRKFGDQRTVAAYIADFRTTKQQPNEDAGTFLDRVAHTARKAFPTVFAGNEDDAQRELIKHQFVEGLRAKEVRRTLLFVPTETLALLRELAVNLEKNELTIGPGTKQNQSQGEAFATVNSQPQFRANSQVNRNSSAPHCDVCGKFGHKTENCRQLNSVPNAPMQKERIICQICNRVGHTAQTCYQLPQNSHLKPGAKNTQNANASIQKTNATPQRNAQRNVCNRCGRTGHTANICWAPFTVEGAKLSFNGITKPPGFVPKNARPTNASYANVAQRNTDHLNGQQGAAVNSPTRCTQDARAPSPAPNRW